MGPLTALLLFFGVAVASQWASGAYSGEFGRDPDEPGHFITGLMVRDYIASGFPGSPLKYAENYYLHYPKVSIGHWPPFFYLLQSAWTLPFPITFPSLLLFMAVLTAMLAAVTFELIRSEFGSAAGFLMGTLLTLLPLVRTYYTMLMAEIPVALLCLCAALCFGRYLDSGRWQDSAWFGVFAAGAIMTKGNGLSLALVPLFAVVLSRRFHMLKCFSFWLPGLTVIAVCGPWVWLTLGMVRNGWSGGFSKEFVVRALPFNLWALNVLMGAGLLVLGVIGFSTRIAAPAWRGGQLRGNWLAAASLLLSVYVFHSFVPASLDARHLITAAPPLLLFAAAGFAWMLSRPLFGGLAFRWRAGVLALPFAALFLVNAFPVVPAFRQGYGKVAKDLLAKTDLRDSVFLVSSTAGGEGGFISEVAMHEKRPGHVVLRGTKVLGTSDWSGGAYKLLYESPDQVMSFLESVPVRVLVIDSARRVSQRDHQAVLLNMLRKYPERWKLMGAYPLLGPSGVPLSEVRVYQLVGAGDKTRPKIKIDMRFSIGRDIEG